jgi:hypothetical protein
MSTGTEPATADPLTALNNEYGAEWNVRRPGRYVADHRRLDVTLISDSVPELTLRAYHLNRVMSKFTMVISAEKAELLAGLLGSDSDDQQDVA